MVKKHAPATLRNREAILGVLRDELPIAGTVLEIASGTGEHAVFFAQHLTNLDWQPSDPAPDALESIAAYRLDVDLPNLQAPVEIDAMHADWAVVDAAAIVCINMVHISPWEATLGLFAGAARILSAKNAPLVLYGPYFEQGAAPAASNIQFDESLKARNRAWGIRDLADMDALAANHGLTRTARYQMSANNLTLVYRKA